MNSDHRRAQKTIACGIVFLSIFCIAAFFASFTDDGALRVLPFALSYFTIVSTAISGAQAVRVAIEGLREAGQDAFARALSLSLVMTVFASVQNLVFAQQFDLSPLTVVAHYAIPAATMAIWLMRGFRAPLSRGNIPKMVVVLAGYAGYVMLWGHLSGRYPYIWLDPRETTPLVIAAGMAAVGATASVLMLLLSAANRSPRDRLGRRRALLSALRPKLERNAALGGEAAV